MTRRTYSELQPDVSPDRNEAEMDRQIHAGLSTPEGKVLLALMHRMTTFKRNRPEHSDGALRWAEAQRNFVAILEDRAARHSLRIAKPTEAKQADVRPGNEPQPRRRRSRSSAS